MLIWQNIRFLIIFFAGSVAAVAQTADSTFAANYIPYSLIHRIHWQLISDSSGASELQLEARAKIWEIQNRQSLGNALVLTFQNLQTIDKRRQYMLGTSPSRQQAKVDLSVGSSTAANILQAADAGVQGEIQGGHGRRGSGGFVFPVLTTAILAAKGAKMGYDYLKGLPLINLGNRHLAMMDVLWEQPDLTAINWYQFYYRRQPQPAPSFLTFAADLDSLQHQQVVVPRDIEGQKYPRYHPLETPLTLKERVLSDLNNHDWPLNSKTRQRLIAILSRLEP